MCIWWEDGNLEQDMEKLDCIIIPSHAQLLFCPLLTLSVLLLREISVGEEGVGLGGRHKEKEVSLQNGWWAMSSHSAAAVADCGAGNERSYVKLSQVWDLLALQASFLSHLSHWVINIIHLYIYGADCFFLTGNCWSSFSLLTSFVLFWQLWSLIFPARSQRLRWRIVYKNAV